MDILLWGIEYDEDYINPKLWNIFNSGVKEWCTFDTHFTLAFCNVVLVAIVVLVTIVVLVAVVVLVAIVITNDFNGSDFSMYELNPLKSFFEQIALTNQATEGHFTRGLPWCKCFFDGFWHTVTVIMRTVTNYIVIISADARKSVKRIDQNFFCKSHQSKGFPPSLLTNQCCYNVVHDLF